MYKKLFFGLLIFSVSMQMYASGSHTYESYHAAYVHRQAADKGAIVGITRSFLKLQQMNLTIDNEHDVFEIEYSSNANTSVVIGYKEGFFAPGGVSALPCHREDYTKYPEVQCVLHDIATYVEARKNQGSSSSGWQIFPVSRIRNDEQHINRLARDIIGVCY